MSAKPLKFGRAKLGACARLAKLASPSVRYCPPALIRQALDGGGSTALAAGALGFLALACRIAELGFAAGALGFAAGAVGFTAVTLGFTAGTLGFAAGAAAGSAA